MKRITLLLIAILAIGFISTTEAQRAIKKGSSINLIIGFPSAEFGSDEAVNSAYELSTIWGIQFGNRWYIAPMEKFGVGIMVNWVDFTIGAKQGTFAGLDWARAVIDLSLVEFGPVATFAITDDMAVDGYYNLRPTILSSASVFSNFSGNDETFAYAGFGFSHAVGAAFRWKVINVGIEYVAGSIKSKGTYTGSLDQTLPDVNNKVNSVRLLLGVKF